MDPDKDNKTIFDVSINCKNICRLCLGSNANFNIFNKNNTIIDKIQTCCTLQIIENDRLPDHICPDCLKILDVSFNFRRTCEENDRILRKNLNIVEPTIKNENDDIKDEFLSDYYDHSNDGDQSYDEDNYPLQTILTCNKELSLKKKYKSLNGQKKKKDKSTKKLVKKIKVKLKEQLLDEGLLNNDIEIKDEIKLENVCEKITKKKEKLATRCGGLCPFCGKFFTKTLTLNSHVRKHTLTDVFTCAECPKSFNELRRLKEHERTHLNIRDFPCEACGKLFSTRSCAKKHFESVHQRAKVVFCKLCNKKLATSHSLKGHMKIHTGEREFECNVCHKKFAFKCSLLVHSRCHTGEKPYSCKFCDAKFAALKTIKEHERLHTGESPYKCPVCAKGFKQKSNMKSHFRNNHKGIEYT